jgi:ferredoxin
MIVRILRKECCGHALCCDLAPTVFVIDSQQKATVLDPDSVAPEVLIEAAEECPCSAIVVENDDGEQVSP